jgi:uncharacterized protein YcgL (UPF0745 family)
VTHATEISALEVDVYKTAARPLTFLFVPSELQPDCWPADLCALFLAPEKVLSITLTPDRTLAAQSATTVMEAIRARGYFLQLPPDPQIRRR